MKHRSHQSLVCPKGHAFEVPSQEVLGEFVMCPECRARVTVDSPAEPARRGLWQLMGQPAESNPGADDTAESTADADQPQPAPPQFQTPDSISRIGLRDESHARSAGPTTQASSESEALSDPTAETSDKPAPLGFKALWQRALANDLPAAPLPNESADEPVGELVKPKSLAAESPADSSPEKPRGLWALMGAPAEAAVAPTSPEPAPLNRSSEPMLKDDNESDGQEIDDSDDVVAAPVSAPVPVPFLTAAAERKVRQVARRALTLGVLALLFAPLSLTPFFGLRVPAAGCGLMAVLWGYQSWDESRRSIERRKLAKLSIAAMVCGLLGILAGPAGLNALGKQWQQGTLHEGAAGNLQNIGRTLDEFHARYGYYPNGETVAGMKGEGVGQQSWLTELLPFLGRTDLLQQIDLRQPYDHPANHIVMSRPVAPFLVPGVPHVANKQGLATTHFSGVGGQRSDHNGQVNLGVFGRNTTITRSEITDGLSQTIIVGEITQRLPAWGDPENWRAIETGLNKHAYGFGNASSTGAHFLMADGSVRFLPNSTALEVLEKLSSRDGSDPVSLDPE